MPVAPSAAPPSTEPPAPCAAAGRENCGPNAAAAKLQAAMEMSFFINRSFSRVVVAVCRAASAPSDGSGVPDPQFLLHLLPAALSRPYRRRRLPRAPAPTLQARLAPCPRQVRLGLRYAR